MWLNSYFTSSLSWIPGRTPPPPPSATRNDLGHRPVTRLVRLRPSAHLMHCRHCPELTPGAQKTSNSPSAIFSSLGSRYPSRDMGVLSPSSMGASQPYTACKLTVPPWNGFLQPGVLKHDHEHVPYFLSKAARDIRHFEPHLLRGSKAKLDQTQRNHPAPQWLRIAAPQKDSTRPYSSTGHHLENHSQGPRHQPQFSQQFFMGSVTEPMMPELCYKFG